MYIIANSCEIKDFNVLITDAIKDVFEDESDIKREEIHEAPREEPHEEPYEEPQEEQDETEKTPQTNPNYIQNPPNQRPKVHKPKRTNEDMSGRTRHTTHPTARLGGNRDSNLGVLPRTQTKPRRHNRQSNPQDT